MQTLSELAPGTLFGRYRIERLLGRGGMGSVYAAEQLDDGRTVALKVLSTTLDTSEDRARFLREGRIAASINHPNTVYVYRTEEIDGSPTIAMEMVDGGTLEDKVARQGPLPIADAIRAILAIINGLDAAYRSGILHRDVKPANCFVSSSGEVKVGDFGLSRPVDRASETRLTQTGLFLGTPVFSSPEQLLGEPLDVRADIYAVGATLYYLLSGKLPYESDNAVRLVANVLSGGAVPLSARRPDLPKALDALVMKCLARAREDRFADYAELHEALAAFQPTVMVPAPLGRRLAAGMVDAFVLSVLTSPVALALGIDIDDIASITFRDMLIGSMVSLPFYLAWYGVLEGRFGWSPAKYAAGLRVVGEHGGVPGLQRGLARATIFWFPAILGDIAWGLTSGTGAQTVAQACVMYGAIALMFARARRENGFASEYDRLTGTRVVRRTEAKAFHRGGAAVQPVAEPTPALADMLVGPYAIVDRPGPAAGVVEGYDRELGRRVWIVRSPAGSPPTSAVERLSIRAGCLRWLGGQRTDAEGWDAYAAVSGTNLRARLRCRADWASVHHWIEGLVTELEARDAAGLSHDSLTVDHVWITDDEDAVLLPFTSGDGTGSRTQAPLLRQVAALVSAADDAVLERYRWPLRAKALLSAMQSEPTDLARLREALQASANHAEPPTARKRVMIGVATLTPAVLFALVVGGALIVNLRRQPELNRLAPLLSYLTSRRSATLQERANRELVGHYVAAHFRKEISGRAPEAPGSIEFIDEDEWRVADSLVAALPALSAAQRSAADRLVDSTWNGRPPGSPRPVDILGIVILAMPLCLAAAAALLAALLARRGFIMRFFGLDVVTMGGSPAGRLRLFWRQAVTWAGPLLLWGGGAALLLGRVTPRATAVAAFALLLLAATIYFIWRTPVRGLAERLSGTIVVPE